ncbi:hypothetical protein BGZ63DRAFT_375695 [Mariannaea sp. PMI_226]|nr:hypothetical protein BGZ63DRAFT_375695 [Mariannaea sp. PMI_226]
MKYYVWRGRYDWTMEGSVVAGEEDLLAGYTERLLRQQPRHDQAVAYREGRRRAQGGNGGSEEGS